MSRRTYDRAPLFEVGISLFTEANGLVDAYDIKGLHDRYRDIFPNVEKQLPIIAGTNGTPFQVTGPEDDHHRWWFVSEDGRDLVQVQTNFLGRNWRRQSLPGGDMPPYGGFSSLLTSLEDCWGRLTASITDAGRDMPEISRVEVFYDNMLPYGDGVRIRDVLEGIALGTPGPVSNFQLAWSESLPNSASGHLQIEARAVHATAPTGEQGDFIRLRFIAKDDASTLEEALAILNEAHATMTDRLHSLTTEAYRATWKAS
ncbi:TIGR04255 family protein [Brevundimonas subvibrioides]|uniref:TIGR04255 family protein n=1 Tax=Brevundimonas subvibrioides (strain ATCC 15264 / DSM 4735 / LMG 14903 / NBRC 16000 / CB 81) TaxID=633149 RepID=D9QIB7_BRESC|nr:TIGR04255 family protein [Brevundimonas subvibrioides]ADK99419.1 hypothetical protein Bresu_0105 [Brevundimonas subvibrioides ATCC 15264]